MKAAVTALVMLVCVATPGAFALGPCSFLRLDIVSFDHDGHNSVKGDARVSCYTYGMDEWYGAFRARTWIVNESAGGTTVSEARGGPFTHTHVWVGATTATAPRDECFRLYVHGESTLYTNQIGSSQVCNDCNVNPWRIGCGDPPPDCPLLLNLGTGPWRLTGRDDAVRFDIDGDGQRDTVTWTAAGAELAFLAIDDNRNGAIDGGQELFGTARRMPDGSLAPHGFAALAPHDLNSDGVIDAGDPLFDDLLLWVDRNHNGVSEGSELQSIAKSNVTGLTVTFNTVGRSDPHGNEFRLKGSVHTEHGRRPYYDVFLLRVE